MATQEPGRAPAPLASMPRIEELPLSEQGFDPEKVREAFDTFRRHVLQLQAQLRVLQAAGGTAKGEATAHAVRMDALHLIRGAAEFADTLERDAQNATAAQYARAEEEIRRGQHELQTREAEIERYRLESERQRADVLNAARTEARELLANAHRDATNELREAESRGTRLLEQARHSATELTNSARAEVEQTLEWARAQAGVIVARAQQGAEQLLSAAGLAPEEMAKVVEAILRSAEAAGRPEPFERRPAAAIAAPPVAALSGQPASTPPAPEPPPAATPPPNPFPPAGPSAEHEESDGGEQ